MDDKTIHILHHTLCALQRVERCEEHYAPADVREEVATNLVAEDKSVADLDAAFDAASDLLTVLRDALLAAQQAANTPDCEECGAEQGYEWEGSTRHLCYACSVESESDVEHPRFDVILIDAGPRWVSVTRALRKYWFGQLGDWLLVPSVRKIVPMVTNAGPDCKVREGVSKEEALRLKQQLEAVGAKVEVR